MVRYFSGIEWRRVVSYAPNFSAWLLAVALRKNESMPGDAGHCTIIISVCVLTPGVSTFRWFRRDPYGQPGTLCSQHSGSANHQTALRSCLRRNGRARRTKSRQSRWLEMGVLVQQNMPSNKEPPWALGWASSISWISATPAGMPSTNHLSMPSNRCLRGDPLRPRPFHFIFLDLSKDLNMGSHFENHYNPLPSYYLDSGDGL